MTDHGALTGLGDDDHPQYLRRTEIDSMLASIVVAGGAVVTADGEVVWTTHPGS